MENSKIEWTTHSWNPWMGCSKVAAGCTHCYAEAFAKRYGKATWGPNGTRVKTSDAYWRKPLKWNKDAEKSGTRPRVFCASLADVFEDWQGPISDNHGNHLFFDQVGDWMFLDPESPTSVEYAAGKHGKRLGTMDDVRRMLFALIDATPNLDWLLLTKRPENIRRLWVSRVNEIDYRPNVWLGTSVSDQETYDRNAHQLYHNGRDLVPVLFLSGEPLLGPIKLWHDFDGDKTRNWNGCFDLCIVGGESGPGARRCRPEWIRSIVKQCKESGTTCFVKQLGSNIVCRNDEIEDHFNSLDTGWPDPHVEHDINGFREEYQGADCRIRLVDKKGGDWNEWPADLRVREFPANEGAAK